jgi:hypothetical protein
VGKTITSYGVGSLKSFPKGIPPESEYIYQRHYQWVIPVLALQAILFYIPRILWQNMENGLMEKLLHNTGKS